MSAIYNLEPQPTGSAILHTTQGDISIELFAKQTPLTCRNFLQHCVDGYYDNTIFHRLIPGFILQGGDPTGTGHGGESIYDGGAFSDELDPWPMDQRHGRNAGPTGVGMKDEFHSRLKFTRRGLLGMANESRPDTNGSQFFFTLAKADELTGKNTLFGRVVGDTIYNLAKMGEAEVDEATGRPLYPVKITSVEILVNPFQDIVKRTRAAPQAGKTVVVDRKKKKRKGGKQLLSFGDEEGGDEDLPTLKKPKFDTRIVVDVENEDREQEEVKKPAPRKDGRKVKAVAPKETKHKDEEAQVEETQKERDSEPRYDSPSPEPEAAQRKTQLEKTKDEIAALKASLKRPTLSEPTKENEKKKSALEMMLSETATRGGRRRGARSQSGTEDQRSIDIMKGWELKLVSAQPEKEKSSRHSPRRKEETKKVDIEDEEETRCDLHFIPNCQSCQAWDKAEENEDSGDEGFMSHVMNCKTDKLGKDLSYRKKAEEELMVIDPRAKVQTIKEKKRAEREARSGKSGREWDQVRNAQMARAASMAGRGAK